MSRKNPLKGALIVSVVAVVIAAVSYFFLNGRQEKIDKAKDRASLLYPDTDRSKIVEFKFENSTGSFQVKKKAQPADEWSITSAKTFDGDKGSIDGMISTILSSKKESTVASTNLASMGLETPKYKLSVPNGGHGDSQLYLGEDTPVDYYTYAKWGDKPEVFLTSRSLRFALDKKLSDIRNKKVFTPTALQNNLSALEIKTLAHDKVTSQNLKLVFNAESGKWKSDGKVKATLENGEIDKFLKPFDDLNVAGFASEDPADRNKLGFKAPLAKIILTPRSAKGTPDATPVVWVLASAVEKSLEKSSEKSKDGSAEKTKKSLPPPTKYYFARLDQDSTYEVGETFRDNFKVDLNRFRSKGILNNISRSEVTGLTLSDDKNTLELEKNGNDWILKSSGASGPSQAPAKKDIVEALLGKLLGLQAKNFLDDQSPLQLGLKKPTRVVQLSATKDGKSQSLATLFFGKKLSPTTYAGRADGMEAAAEIEINLDDQVPLDPNHYLAVPPPAPAKTGPDKSVANGTNNSSTGGSTKVKLEPTVSSIKDIKKLPGPIVKPGERYTAEITMDSGSKIVLTFAPDKAPYTVSNFLHLARNHFYDGVKFHRVIKDFVAQGGDPTGTGAGGPGYKFDNEDNDLKHERGSISMAHAGRNTNGSQFFLVLKPQPHLDGVHTVFGKVTEGLDAMDLIKQGDTMKKVEVFEEKL